MAVCFRIESSPWQKSLHKCVRMRYGARQRGLLLLSLTCASSRSIWMQVQHREEFLRSYGQHLPRDFVSGLAEKPSHCEFRMRPFDQNLPSIEDEDDDDISVTEEKERAPSVDLVDREDRGSLSDSTANADRALQDRCSELEARVLKLTAELEESKKNLYYGSGSESIPRSDTSKASAREGDSSCEFPLVMALAATAGGMTNSSEGDGLSLRRNIGERREIASERMFPTSVLTCSYVRMGQMSTTKRR